MAEHSLKSYSSRGPARFAHSLWSESSKWTLDLREQAGSTTGEITGWVLINRPMGFEVLAFKVSKYFLYAFDIQVKICNSNKYTYHREGTTLKLASDSSFSANWLKEYFSVFFCSFGLISSISSSSKCINTLTYQI